MSKIIKTTNTLYRRAYQPPARKTQKCAKRTDIHIVKFLF